MRKGIIATASLGLIAACAAPLPIVRLQPQGSEVVWVAGRAVVASDRAGIRVATAFDHQDGRYLAFRVEVANDSQERFDVDPKEMHFATCASEANCSLKRPVADPEQKLLALDHAHAQAEADARNMAATGTALVLLSATADVASSTGGRSQHWGERAMLASLSVDNSVAASHHSLGSIDANRFAWSAAAFRRTTLLPGHGAAGLVYVPLRPEAKYVWLEVTVAGEDFSFPFQQEVTAAPRHGATER